MATLAELSRLGTGLSTQQLQHLQRLVAWWGILADLSFSDLLLFVPVDRSGEEFAIASQIRPTTGQTLYQDDHVGLRVSDIDRPLVASAYGRAEVIEGEVPIKPTNRRASVMCIPIRHEAQIIGVLSRELLPNFAERRDPGELERTYLEAFHQLAKMIAAGTFPYQDNEVDLEQVPRVGDGMLVIDPESRIQYASPNALSTLHRVGVLGNVAGRRLADIGIRHPAIKAVSKYLAQCHDRWLYQRGIWGDRFGALGIFARSRSPPWPGGGDDGVFTSAVATRGRRGGSLKSCLWHQWHHHGAQALLGGAGGVAGGGGGLSRLGEGGGVGPAMWSSCG